MVEGESTAQGVPVMFSGTRRELSGVVLRGYALLLPTIGLYRFWLTNKKRQFYWSHTRIDGDELEYTGDASQLLLGFLMALAVFVPLYGLFFYLSTQSSEAAIVGYGGIAILIWFLAGYAIYRARDFRLSRTLWRGIRFDQRGSAWGYALRRFGWSLLMLLTAGLIYPFMSASLWRYRYSHSWYGDRQLGFTGSWKQLAWPYYLRYIVGVLIGGTGLIVASAMGALPTGGEPVNPSGYVPLVIAAALVGLVAVSYQSRELTRMFSAVCLGPAALTVHVRARSLVAIYLQFGLALVGAYVVLAIGGFVVLGTLASQAFADGSFDLQLFLSQLQSSLAVAVATVLGYLLILGAFNLVRDLFIGVGFWKLVARGATITGVETLYAVKASDEDKALVGEGLADALNVGTY